MKNKIYNFIFLLFFSLFSLNVNSQEQFNFDVTQIDILENGNKFIGTKRGTITSNDGIIINADQFEYQKKLNILNANGNVKIIDQINNFEIYSDNITYDKNNNFIFTDKNSKAFDLVNNFEISADRFEYNITKNIITAKNNAVIENKTENSFFKNNICVSKPIIIFIGGGSKLLSNNLNIDFNDRRLLLLSLSLLLILPLFKL